MPTMASKGMLKNLGVQVAGIRAGHIEAPQLPMMTCHWFTKMGSDNLSKGAFWAGPRCQRDSNWDWVVVAPVCKHLHVHKDQINQNPSVTNGVFRNVAYYVILTGQLWCNLFELSRERERLRFCKQPNDL